MFAFLLVANGSALVALPNVVWTRKKKTHTHMTYYIHRDGKERERTRAQTQSTEWTSSSSRAAVNGILFWYIIYPVFRIAHQFNERFRLNVMCGALNQWELRCTCSNEDVELKRAVKNSTEFISATCCCWTAKKEFVVFSQSEERKHFNKKKTIFFVRHIYLWKERKINERHEPQENEL